MFYFYTLKSTIDKKLYFGYTAELQQRFLEHNKGLVRSTKNRRPFVLAYYEAYRSEKGARNRERQIKNRAKAHSGLKQRIRNSLLE